MSYKLPLKNTEEKPKWITATLICIYLIVAVFIFFNS